MDPNKTDEFKKKLANAISVAVDARMKDSERRIMSTVGKDVAEMLKPFLIEVANNAKTSKENLRDVVQELASSANAREFAGIDTGAIIEAIYVAFGNVQMPQPKVSVTTPKVDIPPLKWPEGNMPIEGWVRLMGYDHQNPMSVQIRDAKGNPVNLDLSRIAVGGGSSGGKADYFTIKGFSASAYADYVNSDNRLRVSVETGGSGLTDAELRASSVPVEQVSGSIWSTYITGANGTIAANVVDSTGVAYSGSNPLPVVFGSSATSATNIVDSSGVAYSGSNPLPIVGPVVVTSITNTTAANIVDSSGVAYSGSNPLPIVGPVVVTSITNTTAATIIDSTGVGYSGSNPVPVVLASGAGASQAVTLIDSSGVGYSGSNPLPIVGPVVVTSITNSAAAAIVDSTGVAYSGSNPVPITWVSGAGVSTTVNIGDSSGVGYSGSNPVPITIVSGALTSTISVGPSAVGVADDGSAPVQTAAIARTANPSKVSGGQVVKNSADAIGRQLTRPVQVRELIATAYVQLTTGTEATLKAAVAGAYLDLIYVMGANNSDAAVSVDIRPVTAGNVVMTLQIPASGTAGIACPVPLPQTDTGNNWTVDMGDITGTTVSLTALFSQEV